MLLAALGMGIGYSVLMGKNSDNALPASLFSTRADGTLRVISANLQYHSVLEWEELLRPYARTLPVQLHFYTLDTESIRDRSIPELMIEHAMRLPKAIYSFCPPPEVMFWDSMNTATTSETDSSNTEYGLPPVPPALFLRTTNPVRSWLGRVMYIPDQNRQVHTLLVVMESDTLDGHGLFFDLDFLVALGTVVFGVSLLWWLPFIRHLSNPLRRMASYADAVEFEKAAGQGLELRAKDVYPARQDEIGRVGHALVAMTSRMNRLLTGQRQFIRHVAHELNTPLAKAQMGLAVLECKLSGDEKARVQQVMGHIRRLSVLTDEVLSYLQAKAVMAAPNVSDIDLCSFLASIVQAEAPDNDVHVEVEQGLCLRTDREYLQHIMLNLLRNAVQYAGRYGPIVVSARRDSDRVLIVVQDKGPGVPPEELDLLCEPFYRGQTSVKQPGTGLGLSIVKYYATVCGASMVCANGEKGGFVVRIRFPLFPENNKK